MPNSKAPWHHWPVATLTVLFYAVGALDYIFFKLRLGFYLDRFSTEQLQYFSSLPVSLNVVWAIAVWAGLLGAILLWRRNRFSVLLLFAGFIAITFLTAWLSLVHRPSLVSVTGFLGLYLMIGTSAISFLLYLYARWERTEAKL